MSGDKLTEKVIIISQNLNVKFDIFLRRRFFKFRQMKYIRHFVIILPYKRAWSSSEQP